MKPWEKMAEKMRAIRSNQPRITSEEAVQERLSMKIALAQDKPAPKPKNAASFNGRLTTTS